MTSVLVVDDEPLVRLTVRSLEDWSAHGIAIAYEAANGREALDLLDAHAGIDIVLVDVDMPVMNGLDFAETLRERGGPQKLLFLSSFDTFGFARRAFKAGAEDYILKSEMDEGRLLAALLKMAEESSAGTAAADNLPARKDEIVRRLLAGAPQGGEAETEPLPFSVSLPAVAVFLRPEDMRLVRERYAGNIAAFLRVTVDLLRQSPMSRKAVEIFGLSIDRYLALLDADDDAEAFVEHFSRSAWNYLDMAFEAQITGPIGSWGELRTARELAENRFSVSSRLVVRARRYIREHYAEPDLNLSDIAAYAEVSRNHLSWEFARETGENVSAFITRVRIDAAKQLLLNTGCMTYEVAEKVGYANVETFCRAFRKLTGTTPRAFAP